MAALANNLRFPLLGVALCEPSIITVAMIQWLCCGLSFAYMLPSKKVKAVLLRWLCLGAGLSVFLVGPSKTALMLRWLWVGLGLALCPSTMKAAAMADRLRRMLGIGYAAPISSTAPWPDLPPELLGLVLLRMPSHADRVRVGAVCRSWRSGARLLLPWFALRDGTFLSLPDGAVHHMRVPDLLYRVSTGSMLFLVDRDGRCSLVNPCSGKTTPLPINPDHLELRSRWDLRKVVVSDDVRTIVVLTASKTNSKNVTIYTRGAQESPAMEWAPPANSVALDITLFRGKLYVLTRDVEQCIQSRHIDEGLDRFFFYLVASGKWKSTVDGGTDCRSTPHRFGHGMASRCFKVFQAADLSSGHGWWSKVDTLMGHALFVSRGCSRSLAVRGQSVSGGAQEDCIYFMSELSVIGNIEEDFLSSCVYNMRDHTVARLLSKTLAPPGLSDWGIWFPTWLFPAEV